MTMDSNNIFLIGNNPSELSDIYYRLRKNFSTQISFDLKSILKKIKAYSPSCIVIDDNLGSISVKKFIKKLSDDRETKYIPITLIKNSNYREVVTEGIQEYILKDSITEDAIYRSVINAIRFKKSPAVIYRHRRRQVKRWLRPFVKKHA